MSFLCCYGHSHSFAKMWVEGLCYSTGGGNWKTVSKLKYLHSAKRKGGGGYPGKRQQSCMTCMNLEIPASDYHLPLLFNEHSKGRLRHEDRSSGPNHTFKGTVSRDFGIFKDIYIGRASFRDPLLIFFKFLFSVVIELFNLKDPMRLMQKTYLFPL